MFDDILERKKAFLDYKKQKVKKVKKSGFFQRGKSMALVKNLNDFFHPFIFSKIRQENLSDDVLERKKAFLDSKIRKLKKSKI